MPHTLSCARAASEAVADTDRGDIAPQLSRFSLYALPPSETAATIAARRALMSRKGLSVEEVAQRAHERQREAGMPRRMDRTAWLLLGAIVSGALLAWYGSAQYAQFLLLAGYVLSGLALVALLARLTHAPVPLPLDRFYLPDERLATAEDIVLLRRLAGEDPELEAATNAWWRSPAPIRRGDIRLALDLRRAKLG